MYPRRVLITGAARRIGRRLAEAFAAVGSAVVVHYRSSASEASELVASLPLPREGRHQAVCADLSEMTGPSVLFDAVMAEGPLPDCLINNASSYRRMPLAAATPDVTMEDFIVNFAAPFELMRLFKERCGHGQIINMLDYRVAMADADSGAYALAKKALKDATEASALQWAPEIRVNAIAPGIVLTPPGVPMERMQRLIDRVPMRRRTTEDELASAALFLASVPSANGVTLFLDGGLHLLGARASGERKGKA